ncbi:HAMP domain-containing sensor histidine kinase [Paenibacillus thiaminolyticus]|uniref:sensor histidine kinase n=1 Tax=Paenibacillus thiaminolyticus TaxID=49283 RepID=UPI0035A66BDD
MKLIYRLNLSFGLLLLLILALTAALIYPLLFNTLVENQRREMREQGSNLLQTLAPGNKDEQQGPAQPNLPARENGVILETPTMIISSNSLAGKEDEQQGPAQPNLPARENGVILETSTTVYSYNSLAGKEDLNWKEIVLQNASGNSVWQGKNDQYIIETSKAPIEDASEAVAILATPLSKVKSMHLELFQRMMLILSIGGILTFLVCMFITRKLVTPLSALRQELKKVESRRFSEVHRVQSDGEVGEVADSVYQLARELEQYQLTQKQFFQNASHELKTPLMSIQGYAEGIKDGIFTGGRAVKGLDVIVRECEHLKHIVTEMILLAKLESEVGIFHMEEVSVLDLILETMERMKPIVLNEGLFLEVEHDEQEKPCMIYADREKVLQALINITSNATRYAKHRIRMKVKANSTGVDIEITDDGEGIPDALLPYIFNRFTKGKQGDTGLGLAISRAIVERCRGRIVARNLPNQEGAVFELHFPRE